MRKQIIFDWLIVLAYMMVIFIVSAQSRLPSVVNQFNDKSLHILEYTILGIIFARALFHTKPDWSWTKIIVVTTLFCFLYGLSDEFHQSFVPGRDASIFDALADATGGFLGGVVWRVIWNLK